MNKSFITNLKKFIFGAFVLTCGTGFVSCVENIPEENRFTFTGELIADHLENNPEFSMFCKILEKASIGEKASGNLLKTLSTYGSYTCFAPTDSAIEVFMSEQVKDPLSGITSTDVDDLTPAAATNIAKNHIIEMGYRTIDINYGIFPQVTMSRYSIPLSTAVDSIDGTVYVVVDNLSRVIKKDIETENGYIQVINKVINPSNLALPEQFKLYPELSIFTEALHKTGLSDSIREFEIDPDYDGLLFGPIKIQKEGEAPYPEEWRQRYTILAETDSVFAANNINDINDLQTFAEKFYTTECHKDSFTNPGHALNKFVAYHILDRRLHYASNSGPGGFIMENYVGGGGFKSEVNMPTSHDRYDYFETKLPYTLIKVTRPFSKSSPEELKSELVINYAQENGTVCKDPNMQNHLNIVIIKSENSGIKNFNNQATNGTIHTLNKILVYNEQEMAGNVLNERMRWDVASLFPEFTNNDIRWALNTKYKITYIPNNYCKRLVVNSSDSYVYYLRPTGTSLGGYPNYQGDELLVCGKYDFEYRIPYVPAGDYEIRFGYSQSNLRGVCQFYFDDQICGIPVDLRNSEEAKAKVGWFDESELSASEIMENDKAMRNKGYMKAPASYHLDQDNPDSPSGNMRYSELAVRKIVGTFKLDKSRDYWLRFKNVTENSTDDQFNQDYLEIVPTTVITNPNKPEDQY